MVLWINFIFFDSFFTHRPPYQFNLFDRALLPQALRLPRGMLPPRSPCNGFPPNFQWKYRSVRSPLQEFHRACRSSCDRRRRAPPGRRGFLAIVTSSLWDSCAAYGVGRNDGWRAWGMRHSEERAARRRNPLGCRPSSVCSADTSTYTGEAKELCFLAPKTTYEGIPHYRYFVPMGPVRRLRRRAE